MHYETFGTSDLRMPSETRDPSRQTTDTKLVAVTFKPVV